MGETICIGRERLLSIYQELLQECKDVGCKRWQTGCSFLEPKRCGILQEESQKRAAGISSSPMTLGSILCGFHTNEEEDE